jgi:Family of unknown function (DUF5715)
VNDFSRRVVAVALASVGVASAAQAGELGGSITSMKRQHDVAVEHRYTFLATAKQVREYVAKGRLELLSGDANYALNKVSFPYARPEVRLFVERIAADYRTATGDMLVVTSLTRPGALQPRNAHDLSVHPAGMAVDFRVPDDTTARRWLEQTLLTMETDGLIEATRERRPPHYHVAVFRDRFLAYNQGRAAADAAAAAATAVALRALASMTPPARTETRSSFAMPINALLGGAASGFVVLALTALGGAIARLRRKRVPG